MLRPKRRAVKGGQNLLGYADFWTDCKPDVGSIALVIPSNSAGMRSIGLLLVVMVGVAGDAAARINVTSLPGRDSTQLTIYNSVDLTLVTERRTLTFRKGLNRLEFSWANTLIDPTSVEFKASSHADEIEVIM